MSSYRKGYINGGAYPSSSILLPAGRHSVVMHLDTQLLAMISIDGVVTFYITKLNVSYCLYIE
jgi:hypothetical protein